MATISITDPDDPRIEAFRKVRERDLVGRRGLFMVEGEVVLRHLLGPQSRHEAESLLIAENRLEKLAPLLAGIDAPVYAASQDVMDAIVGFPIHRGTLLADPGEADVILGVVGVGNHDNMGGLFRAAAAFGVRAVLIDSTSCDPLYRKAIRVSVGAALITPFVRTASGRSMVESLAAVGYAPLALSPRGEERLIDVRVNGPVAVIVGAEGPGLPEAVLEMCRRVSIPMAPGFDSLNVATSAALALHQARFSR